MIEHPCRDTCVVLTLPASVGLRLTAPAVAEEPRGIALVLALIVMSILAVLTVGSLEVLTLKVQITNNLMHDLQALYIAEAGVENAIYELRNDPSWDDGLDVEFPTGSGNNYTVDVVNSGYPLIVIDSTGTVANFHRTLEAKVEIIGSSSPYSVKTIYWKETY